MKEIRIFKRRTTAPEKGDKWFTMKKGGGISPCIEGRPSAWNYSTLANCVGYAWGRFAFLEENEKCLVGCAMGTDYPSDAWAWYRNSIARGYDTGKEPKLGAVAVWSRANAKGHVAVVEKINADGSWESSESGYNTKPIWFTKKYNAKSTKTGYKFLGFIYPKFEFVEDNYKFKVGDKVKIIKTGNANSFGTGRVAGGVGYTRFILNIYKGRKFPYQVGVLNATTGFYQEDALKKI